MATVGEHREAIKLALEAVFTEANVFDNERKTFPAGATWVVSWPTDYDPDTTLGGGRTITYPVRFEYPWSDDKAADDQLEAAMDAVANAIHTDTTLGGVVESARVMPFTDIGAAQRLGDNATVMQFVAPVEVLD